MTNDANFTTDDNRIPIFDGHILLCEDSEVNQHLIKSHLTMHGLNVTCANNGKEGLEAVVMRIKNKQNPFNLIFMDIQMPVMDGLEACTAIAGLGVKTPVIALSANNTPEHRQAYTKCGMSDTLNKPFTANELCDCLYKYFTPIRYEELSQISRHDEEEKRRTKLLTSFVKKNQTAHSDILNAVSKGDIKTAHRLAHTLRGLAGLMDEKKLHETARTVELSLADGIVSDLDAQMSALGIELKSVLDKLSPYLSEPEILRMDNSSFNKEKALKLFERLEALLKDDNAACQELISDLRAVPETSGLISQIEDYEFEAALELLYNLRKSLEV